MTPSRAKLISRCASWLRVRDPIHVANQMFTWTTKSRKPLSPNTLLSYLSAISVAAQMMSLTIDMKKWKRIVRRAKLMRALHVAVQAIPITQREIRQILKDLSIHMDVRRALALMWSLGLRHADLRHIAVKDISHFRNGVIRIRCRGLKGQEFCPTRGRYRFLRVTGIAGFLNQYLSKDRLSKLDGEDLLFTASRFRCVRAMRNLPPRRGMSVPTNFTSHSPRRGAATHLSRKGVSITKISLFLGHGSVEVTRLYIDPSPLQREPMALLSLCRLLTRRK